MSPQDAETRKVTITLPHIGAGSGIAALLGVILNFTIPSLSTDTAAIQSAVEESVTENLSESIAANTKRIDAAVARADDAVDRVERMVARFSAADARMDKKIETELDHLRKSLDKDVGTIQALINGLKELFLEKAMSCSTASERNRAKLDYLEQTVTKLNILARELNAILGRGEEFTP